MRIIQQGAEAVIKLCENTVIKERIRKSYRIHEIDEKIRKIRTRSEAKLLEKASGIIPVPAFIKSDEKTKEIYMEYIKGKKLSEYLEDFPEKEQTEISEKISENVSKLHNAGIIHGDLTMSNMILSGTEDKIKVYFLDFGLGYMSHKFEDKAVDLHLLKQAMESKHFKNWERLFEVVVNVYMRESKDAKTILKRLETIEKRGRYRN